MTDEVQSNPLFSAVKVKRATNRDDPAVSIEVSVVMEVVIPDELWVNAVLPEGETRGSRLAGMIYERAKVDFDESIAPVIDHKLSQYWREDQPAQSGPSEPAAD